MYYRYDEKAGYYGNGGWVLYHYDGFGYRSPTKVYGSEQELLAEHPDAVVENQ